MGSALRRSRVTFAVIVASAMARFSVDAQIDRLPLQFEAATVRRTAPGHSRTFTIRGGPGTNDPDLFVVENVSLYILVMQAYNLKVGFQLSEVPWMKTEMYDITAKVPSGISKEQFRLMLQTLLAERLGLKVHHETRRPAGYRLVVAKTGPKLQKPSPPPPSGTELPDTERGPRRGIIIGRSGIPELAPGDEPADFVTRAGHTVRARRETLDLTAFRLSEELQRPVVNATDLQGEYNYTLYWSQDPLMTPSVGSSSDGSAPLQPDGLAQNLFVAVQKQLGLKLEPSRSIPVDVLVVDHADKAPAEN